MASERAGRTEGSAGGGRRLPCAGAGAALAALAAVAVPAGRSAPAIAVAASAAPTTAAAPTPATLAVQEAPGPLEVLDWMAGCWERARGELVVEEQWTAPRGGLMLGTGRTLRAGRAVARERLRISAGQGGIVLVAEPSGQARTEFPAVHLSDTLAAFENPAHDFPRRIVYRPAPDSLLARIEGDAGGEPRAVDVPMARVPCGGESAGADAARTPPAPRAHHQLVHHTGRGRALLIGGSTPVDDGHRYFDEIWSWDGSAWVPEPPLPFPRSSHRVVYDGRRDALVLFGGGFAGAVRDEGVIWEGRAGRWRAAGGDLDAGRGEPGLCHDARRGRTVLFGGWDAASEYRGDTWEWDGRALVRVDSAAAPGPRPSPRSGHAFLYDPARERCLLFAGRGPDGDLADTWSWDGREWRRLDAAGPPPRSMAKLAFTGRAILLFGGRRDTPEGFVDVNDTWLLDDGAWDRVGRPAPPGVRNPAPRSLDPR